VTRGLIEYEIDGTIYSVTPIQAVPIEKKIERKARERLIKKAAITRRPKGDTPLGAQAQRELVNPGKAVATQGPVSTATVGTKAQAHEAIAPRHEAALSEAPSETPTAEPSPEATSPAQLLNELLNGESK